MKEWVKNILFSLLVAFLPRQKLLITNKRIGITMLICHRDVKMSIYCLSSFFYQLGFGLPIFMVGDGSLTKKDRQLLQKFFAVELLHVSEYDLD